MPALAAAWFAAETAAVMWCAAMIPVLVPVVIVGMYLRPSADK